MLRSAGFWLGAAVGAGLALMWQARQGRGQIPLTYMPKPLKRRNRLGRTSYSGYGQGSDFRNRGV